jgi:signal transduction histidine kinase
MPEYKGIYEFEFLSENIRDMMIEKQRLMKQIIEEQKLKGIRVLASGIAHNFNNILVGVLGYASLIRTRLESAKKTNQPLQGQMLDEIIKHIDVIETSSQKAGRLAKELALFSKKRELEEDTIASVDINKVIAELNELILNTFPKNIEISTILTENLPVIKGNAHQLEQAILNICINSKDAMPDGGMLFIETYAARITEKIPEYLFLKPGNYVIIKISDTGTGMDEETISHIFEPFFTTKPVDKGIGLGLSAAYSIIKAHRGYIIAESSSGKGSTFTIYLPIE